jgi:cation-transporting ATPase E
MRLPAVELLDGTRAAEALAAMAAADPVPNSTMLAARALRAPRGWRLHRAVSFSSARKWSAKDFADTGRWLLGAPEVVLPRLAGRVAARVSAHAAVGRRALVLARGAAPLRGDDLLSGLAAAALVVLGERLQPEAARTVA